MKPFIIVFYNIVASLKYYQTTYKECDLVIGYWSEWAEWSDCKCKVCSFINKEDFKLQSNKVKLRSHAVRRSVCQGAKATMLLWCRFRHKRMRYVVRSTSHVHWWSVLRRVIRWSLGRVGAMWGHPSESKQTIVIVMRLFIFFSDYEQPAPRRVVLICARRKTIVKSVAVYNHQGHLILSSEEQLLSLTLHLIKSGRFQSTSKLTKFRTVGLVCSAWLTRLLG